MCANTDTLICVESSFFASLPQCFLARFLSGPFKFQTERVPAPHSPTRSVSISYSVDCQNGGRIVSYLEGSGRGLVEVVSRHLREGTEEDRGQPV
jgi:hypothetical protein